MGNSENQKNLAGLLVTKDLYQEEGWRVQGVAPNQVEEEGEGTKTYLILERNNWKSKMLYKPCVSNSKNLVSLYIDR